MFLPNSKTERRARHIADPIERLRYLRIAAHTGDPRRLKRGWRLLCGLALLVAVSMPLGSNAQRKLAVAAPSLSLAVHAGVTNLPDVWLVDKAGDHEVYSNGLRVETQFAVNNEHRSYRTLSRESGLSNGEVRETPAGIVFHATESDAAPFIEDHTRELVRIGQQLVVYTRNKAAYHYLIDRFGRVFRIVRESDAANHAGYSVWADDRAIYLDLNNSFLGVALEASMQAPDGELINNAQLHGARVLTDMLRSKYGLEAGNCVTHAQVSVNPHNMRIGWHTDWGRGFPFQEIGLPDNYQIPIPSVYLFGFEYDSTYLEATSPEAWKGLSLAEKKLRDAADGLAMQPGEYRTSLRSRYRNHNYASRERGAVKEKENASK